MGAVDEASSREDSNTSNHNLRDLLSEGVSMLPLCRLSCSEWVLLHMALIPALFAAAVVCFYLVINGNTELERIVRTLI